MNDNKRSHLEMIQGVVNRLSQNSFLLKGWSVVLVSALMALAAKDSNIIFVLLAYFPSIAFWLLDGYFLWQEKLFRALYDMVRTQEENTINFSMDTSVIKDKVDSWSEVTISKTLLIFHGVVLFSIIVIMFFFIFNK